MDIKYFQKEICGIISNYCSTFLTVCDKCMDIFPFMDKNILYDVINIDASILEILLKYPKFNVHSSLLNKLVTSYRNKRYTDTKTETKIQYIHKIKILLKDNKAVFEDNGEYLFKFAVDKGCSSIMKLLLENKNIVPDYNILKYSVEKRYAKMVELLIKDKRIDPNINDNYIIKKTCLENYIGIVRILLRDDRIDPSCSDNYIIRYLYNTNYIDTARMVVESKRFRITDELIEKIVKQNKNPEIIDLILKNRYK